MAQISEKLTKIFEENKIDMKEKGVQELLDGIIDIESKHLEKEKELEKANELISKQKTQIEEAEKIKDTIAEKDKEINDLKIKYIDTFEKGQDKKKYENEAENPDLKIKDLFETEILD